MVRLAAAALLAAGWLSPAAAGDEGVLPAAAGQIVSDLLSQAPALRGKTMAVGEISDPEGRLTEFSAMFAEALEISLMLPAKSRDLKLLDRRHMEALTKEWELSMSGFVEDDSIKQAGRLLGVDVLLLGRYTVPGKKRIDLRATLVEAETGQILAAATTQLKADKRLQAAREKPLPAPAPKAAPKSGQEEALKVEVWTEKAEYRVGEQFRVKVRASQDCYLTLVDVGTSGGVTVIFPNHHARDNAVKAGVTYTIPDPAAGFDFMVSGPPGRELIRAIASRAPAVDLSDILNQVGPRNPFAEVTKDLPGFTRDIHVHAKKAKPGEWSEALLQLKIR